MGNNSSTGASAAPLAVEGFWYGFYRDNWVQLWLNADGSFEIRDSDFDCVGVVIQDRLNGTWTSDATTMTLTLVATSASQYEWYPGRNLAKSEFNTRCYPATHTTKVDNRSTGLVVQWQECDLTKGTPSDSLRALHQRRWLSDEDLNNALQNIHLHNGPSQIQHA